MKVWIELKVKGKQEVYLKMQYDGFKVCSDGSISNWLETNFSLKGWKITAIGIMTDYIAVEIEGLKMESKRYCPIKDGYCNDNCHHQTYWGLRHEMSWL